MGEVDAALVVDAAINARFDLYSGVASVSAKPGLARSEVLVLANSSRWCSGFRIEHGVMRDILDTASVGAVLARLGVRSSGWGLCAAERARVVGVFAKSEADPRKVRAHCTDTCH